jgi:hypothetical protein
MLILNLVNPTLSDTLHRTGIHFKSLKLKTANLDS